MATLAPSRGYYASLDERSFGRIGRFFEGESTSELGLRSSLARDLASQPPFERWIVDIANPALIALMRREMSEHVNRAGIPFKFGPADGPGFFESCGWTPIDVRSAFRTAADLKRLPPELQAYEQFPDPPHPWELPDPWSGVCLLQRT